MSCPIMLSVLIPAYNESARLGDALAEALGVLSAAQAEAGGRSFELIVIDDGSVDPTARIADEWAQRDGRVHVVSYQPNAGKGAALVRGFAASSGELVAFLDADLDLHPRLLLDLLTAMQAQGADVVIGSKHHPRSTVQYPLVRRVYSAGYYALARVLLGLPVRDTQTGIKLFKREVLVAVFPRMKVKRYAFDLDLLALAHQAGYGIAEAPVTVTAQRTRSRIRLRDVAIMARDTLGIWWRLRVRGKGR